MAKVHVEQEEGEIRISAAGEADLYQVQGGVVDVPDGKLTEFLARVPGARLEGSTTEPETGSKKKG